MNNQWHLLHRRTDRSVRAQLLAAMPNEVVMTGWLVMLSPCEMLFRLEDQFRRCCQRKTFLDQSVDMPSLSRLSELNEVYRLMSTQ